MNGSVKAACFIGATIKNAARTKDWGSGIHSKGPVPSIFAIKMALLTSCMVS